MRAPRSCGSRLAGWRLLALCAAAAGAGCADDARERDAEGSRLARREQLRAQFASVQAQLRATQAQALDSPRVRAAQEAFYAELRQRMLEIDSASAILLDRASGVGEELTRVSGSPTATPDEKERVARDLQTLERALRPIQDSAFRDPEVAESFRTLQDSLVATMRRIDPGSGPLLERMRSLERQIAELDRGSGADAAWVPGGPAPAPPPGSPGGAGGEPAAGDGGAEAPSGDGGGRAGDG